MLLELLGEFVAALAGTVADAAEGDVRAEAALFLAKAQIGQAPLDRGVQCDHLARSPRRTPSQTVRGLVDVGKRAGAVGLDVERGRAGARLGKPAADVGDFEQVDVAQELERPVQLFGPDPCDVGLGRAAQRSISWQARLRTSGGSSTATNVRTRRRIG